MGWVDNTGKYHDSVLGGEEYQAYQSQDKNNNVVDDGFDDSGGNWFGQNGLVGDNPKPKLKDMDRINQGYADMLRSEYDDWKTRFKPFEQVQRDMLMDPDKRREMRGNALGYVDAGVNSAFGQTKANMAMNDRKFGRALGADEREARSRRLGNAKVGALASGHTRMNQAVNDRELRMLSGGIG